MKCFVCLDVSSTKLDVCIMLSDTSTPVTASLSNDLSGATEIKNHILDLNHAFRYIIPCFSVAFKNFILFVISKFSVRLSYFISLKPKYKTHSFCFFTIVSYSTITYFTLLFFLNNSNSLFINYSNYFLFCFIPYIAKKYEKADKNILKRPLHC